MANATNATCRAGYQRYVIGRNSGETSSRAFRDAIDWLRKDGHNPVPTGRSHLYWRRLYKAGFRQMPAPMNRGEAALGGSPFDESYA